MSEIDFSTLAELCLIITGRDSYKAGIFKIGDLYKLESLKAVIFKTENIQNGEFAKAGIFKGGNH